MFLQFPFQGGGSRKRRSALLTHLSRCPYLQLSLVSFRKRLDQRDDPRRAASHEQQKADMPDGSRDGTPSAESFGGKDLTSSGSDDDTDLGRAVQRVVHDLGSAQRHRVLDRKLQRCDAAGDAGSNADERLSVVRKRRARQLTIRVDASTLREDGIDNGR